MEIHDFIPATYFVIVAMAMEAGGEFKMRHALWDRVLKREIAKSVVEATSNLGWLFGMRVEAKRQRPLRLHDLPSLQKLCASRFGCLLKKYGLLPTVVFTDRLRSYQVS